VESIPGAFRISAITLDADRLLRQRTSATKDNGVINRHLICVVLDELDTGPTALLLTGFKERIRSGVWRIRGFSSGIQSPSLPGYTSKRKNHIRCHCTFFLSSTRIPHHRIDNRTKNPVDRYGKDHKTNITRVRNMIPMMDDESGRLGTQPCKLLDRPSSQLWRLLDHSRDLDNLV
jgi:hypothetical protein